MSLLPRAPQPTTPSTLEMLLRVILAREASQALSSALVSALLVSILQGRCR